MPGFSDLNVNVGGYVPTPMLQPTDYGLAAMSGWGTQGGLQMSSSGTPVLGTGSVPGATPGGDAGFMGGLFSGFLDKRDVNGVTQQGWGMPAIGAAQGIFNAYMGMKQYGLYKDQLKEGKRQFELNYDAQRQTTNSALEDRQRARVASNAGAYQSVGDYMNQNAIRGS